MTARSRRTGSPARSRSPTVRAGRARPAPVSSLDLEAEHVAFGIVAEEEARIAAGPCWRLRIDAAAEPAGFTSRMVQVHDRIVEADGAGFAALHGLTVIRGHQVGRYLVNREHEVRAVQRGVIRIAAPDLRAEHRRVERGHLVLIAREQDRAHSSHVPSFFATSGVRSTTSPTPTANRM